MKVFARVGVSKEILTDQGSDFTSKLLSELYRLLRIEQAAYLPPSDRRSGGEV